jgi:hypothetical protein
MITKVYSRQKGAPMDKLDSVIAAIKTGASQQLAVSANAEQENLRNSRLLDRELVIHLWTLMTEMYGHKWTSQFGDEIDPNNVWAASLKGVTKDQVKHGLNCLVLQGAEWPPSAPEFRKLCTGADEVSWEHKRIERAEDEWRGIKAEWRLTDMTKKQRAKRAGAEALASMKSLWGGK